MGIQVSDVLALDLLTGAKIVAGKAGLDREVLRVNFTDCPLWESDPGYSLVQKGDVYILSLYIQSQNEKELYDLIKFYIQTGSACCLALDTYVKDFPDSVKRLADKYKYPIVSIRDDIPYASLIQKITNLIMTEQLDMYTEVKLHTLLHEQLSPGEQQDTWSYLVPNCPARYACLYIKFSQVAKNTFRHLKNSIFSQFRISFLNYRNGGFLVIDLGVYKKLDHIIKVLPNTFPPEVQDYIFGISDVADRTERLTEAFREAVDAALVGEITGNRVTYYEHIPIYHLLLPLRTHHALKEYCDHILGPLEEYEEHHNVELLETISVYLELNGNIAQTAAQMNTHVNTIRFRINKARALLGLEDESYTFIERLGVALKGRRLLQQ